MIFFTVSFSRFTPSRINWEPKTQRKKIWRKNCAEPFCKTIPPNTVKHRRIPQTVSQNAPFSETILRCFFLFLCFFCSQILKARVSANKTRFYWNDFPKLSLPTICLSFKEKRGQLAQHCPSWLHKLFFAGCFSHSYIRSIKIARKLEVKAFRDSMTTEIWKKKGHSQGVMSERCTIGPIRITQLIPRTFSGVTEVKLITPINSLRIFWCNRWCAPS